MVDALGKEAASYWELHIHCPFLNDGQCLIYEVRPWPCAILFSTTPTEWCNPSSPHEPSLYLTKLTTTPDLPFWDARIAGHYESNMPDMVYRLLTESIKFLWELPGLENLREEFLIDPEVRDFLKQLVKRNTTHHIVT
jgi:Fe-S-cluster containining protein